MDRIIPFRENLREAALDLVWRQWTAAGVAGVRDSSASLIDPEALLVASMTLGRYDARLFDEVLDWLAKNARLLDLSRLRRIAAQATTAERTLLGVAAQIVTKHGGAENFQRLLPSDPEMAGGTPGDQLKNLFFSHEAQEAVWTGRDSLFEAAGFLRSPLRLRGLSGGPKATNSACLRFQVRALVGPSSRAEVLTYLITHEWTHGRLIAERTAYGQAPVASYLVSLFEAGLADRREEGKKMLYRLGGALRDAFSARPTFVDWVRVWPALIQVLEALRLTEPREETGWLRLAQVLTNCGQALRSEGFEIEIGDLRGWALEGPDVLERSVERVTARVVELAS
jgi:DNA-binding transcriptional ArsR family regulator